MKIDVIGYIGAVIREVRGSMCWPPRSPAAFANLVTDGMRQTTTGRAPPSADLLRSYCFGARALGLTKPPEVGMLSVRVAGGRAGSAVATDCVAGTGPDGCGDTERA
jgi:hypothetical protein